MRVNERARVLIVDDTPENIRLLMAILQSSCEVVAATQGRKALEIAAERPPDLILLDVVMPGMNGYEVCERLKQGPKTANIPVIFVTGLADVGEEERGLRLGAVDYITKPFHPELVKARVHNQLELKRHRDYLEEEVERRTLALLEAKSIRQRMESELEVASRLQHSMLPSRTFVDYRFLGCQLATLFQAARAVGGDLYDYFFIDDVSFLFVIGDVSDKGVAAALFMVRVRTLIRSLGPTASDPASLLKAINTSLCEDNPACMFVTMACAVLKIDRGEVVLASGGHEAPLLLAGDGEVRAVEVEGGPALGLIPEAEFQNVSLQLAPHQSLVFYTDGIPEACDRHDGRFGEQRLFECLGRQAGRTPGEVVSALWDALKEFVDGAEPFDDITLLVLNTYLRAQPPPTVRLRGVEELGGFNAWLSESLSLWGFSSEMAQDLELVSEEVIVNVLTHSHCEVGVLELEVTLTRLQDGVQLVFSDNGVAYDPLEERGPRGDDQIGGWGIPILKALVQEQSYSRNQGHNILTLVRRENMAKV